MTKWEEQDWERLTERVAIEASEVASLIGTPVRSLALFPHGKANTNYAVELTTGDRVVLRLYERDREAPERERRLAALVDGAVPVPAMLHSGATAEGTPYGVFEYVEGDHVHEVLDDATAYRLGHTLGRGLRSLEHVEPPAGREGLGLFAPDLTFARTFDSVADSFVDLVSWSLREGRARKRLGPELRQRLAAVVDRAGHRLAPVESWRGLVHGDYKFTNILVRDGELAALLDWEFACAFTPLLDVAILMRHRDDFPADFVHGFEAGHAALPDDWRELSRIIDLMNLVGFLNASGSRPRLFAAVTQRIALTVDALKKTKP